jgi:hypothetical protein
MTILQRVWHGLGILPWLLLIVWFLLPTMSVIDQIQRGAPLPPDLATYLAAAGRLRSGQPLYGTIEEARQIWLSMHGLERANVVADANATVTANIPGPYLYLPPLAIWLYWLGLQPAVCIGLLFLAVVGFSTLWLHSGRSPQPSGGERIVHSSWSLLLVIGSWPALSLLTAGNVEPVLLFVTLTATWALWRNQVVISAPLIAFVVLINPFYALFFAAFGLLMLVNTALVRRAAWNTLSGAAALALIIMTAAVVTWGRTLWQPTLDFVANALAYHWFTLPPAQQTPLSIWNRTPLQGLVNLGLAPQQAQQLALALWGVALLATLWSVRGRRLTLPLTFALALVLLYWGRPVGWALYFLEIVVVLAAWPTLAPWQRTWLLLAVAALMASHWVALVFTLRGVWLRLLTLQSAEFSWETWLVPVFAWLALLVAARRTTGAAAPLAPSPRWEEEPASLSTVGRGAGVEADRE